MSTPHAHLPHGGRRLLMCPWRGQEERTEINPSPQDSKKCECGATMYSVPDLTGIDVNALPVCMCDDFAA